MRMSLLKVRGQHSTVEAVTSERQVSSLRKGLEFGSIEIARRNHRSADGSLVVGLDDRAGNDKQGPFRKKQNPRNITGGGRVLQQRILGRKMGLETFRNFNRGVGLKIVAPSRNNTPLKVDKNKKRIPVRSRSSAHIVA